MNALGRLEHGAVVRHRNPLLCTISHTAFCEGLPGVYSTIWCLCYKTNELEKRKREWGNESGQIGQVKKGEHRDCPVGHENGLDAGEGAECGMAEPSRSTRRER
jgi:hypothetical protein